MPPRTPPVRRRVEVIRTVPLSPHLVRVTFGGAALDGWPVDLPTGHCKVFLPTSGEPEPVIPEWGPDGPVFEPGQPRPTVRTYTPRRFDPVALELDIDFVLHEGGPASEWAARARPGDRAAVAGTGRGYEIDPDAPAFVLLGDETALPAIAVLLEAIRPTASVGVVLEVRNGARIELPAHPRALVRWLEAPVGATPGSELVAAVDRLTVPIDARVWAACEATAVRTVRRALLDCGLPADRIVTRGYWRLGSQDHPDGDYADDA